MMKVTPTTTTMMTVIQADMHDDSIFANSDLLAYYDWKN